MLNHREGLLRTAHGQSQHGQVVQRLRQAVVRWQALPYLEREREVSFRARGVSSPGPQDAAISHDRRDQRGILHLLDDAHCLLGKRHGGLELSGQPEPEGADCVQPDLMRR